jgi:hypothetical protein
LFVSQNNAVVKVQAIIICVGILILIIMIIGLLHVALIIQYYFMIILENLKVCYYQVIQSIHISIIDLPDSLIV